jgi:hypothetical protein
MKKGKPQHNGNEGQATIKVRKPKFKIPPSGLQLARLVGLFDVGTHRITFGGEEKKQAKLVATFELPLCLEVFDEEIGPQPLHQSAIYHNTLTPKSNLYRDLSSWQGKPRIEALRNDPNGNLGFLLGEPAWLNITHETGRDGTLRAKVIGILPVSKETKVPDQISPSLTYCVDTDGIGPGRYDKLPPWIQKIVMASEEIDGEHPSQREITERNVRQATANALEPRPHPPVGINEPSSAQVDEDALNAELSAATADKDPY